MNTSKLRSRINKAAGLSAITAAGLSAAIGLAAPAQAAPAPKTNSLAVAYTAPTPAARIVGGIWSGAPVTMRCWVDNAWVNGTNRWFLVDGAGYNPYNGRPNMVHGYVSASQIADQARVNHC